jgi:pimeloyl-ACP methyl ester carboxylesterase
MTIGQTRGTAGATTRSLRALRVATAEARAFARVAALRARDHEPMVPLGVALDENVVVLVHGLLASAAVMRPLGARLEQLPGVHTASFSYGATAGVAEIADSLRQVVARLPALARIHLVGHSLGGVAIRYFVQHAMTGARVVQTISIAAPFDGARGARFRPGRGGRDLRAESDALRWVRQTATLGAVVPHLSILGEADTAVSELTTFPVGERLLVPECGHNGLLFHPDVAEAVAARVVTYRRPVT